MTGVFIQEAVPEPINVAVHTVVGTGLFVSIMGWLPQAIAMIAATIGTCYYLICVWESKTVQHYVNNKRMVFKAKKVARLKAQEKVIVAQLEALEAVRQAKRAAASKVEQAASEAQRLLVSENTKEDIKYTAPRDK